MLGGVHHQYVARLALLAQHHDDGGDARAKKDIGRKPDDCLNMAVLHQVLANGALLAAAEQHAVGQNDAHDAVGAQVVQIMQKEGVISFGFRSNAEFEARVELLIFRIPVLGVRRVRHHGIDEERIIGLILVLDGVEPGPVVFERIAIARHYVVGKNSTHDQIHTREVVRVLLKLLRIILDGVRVAVASCHGFADIDKQRARSARGIVDGDVLASGQVPRDYLAHEHGDFVRRIELACFLTGVGGEVADQVLVDEAKHVVVLATVHRDVLDEVDEVASGLGLAPCVGAELGETGLQRVENAVEDALAGRVDVAAKSRESVANVRNLEVAALGDPGGEEVFVGDKVAALALDELDRFLIVFHEARQILLGEITCLQAGDFGLGEKLVEDEAQDVILVFICLDFRAHLVGGFPYL